MSQNGEGGLLEMGGGVGLLHKTNSRRRFIREGGLIELLRYSNVILVSLAAVYIVVMQRSLEIAYTWIKMALDTVYPKPLAGPDSFLVCMHSYHV